MCHLHNYDKTDWCVLNQNNKAMIKIKTLYIYATDGDRTVEILQFDLLP